MRRNESGLTLVEVSIGVVLMLIILAVAYPGFILANGTMSMSARKARLQEAGEKVTKQLVDVLRLGQLQQIGPTGVAPFAIVHPPRTGIALDEITQAGAVPWRDETIRIQYRPQRGWRHKGPLRARSHGSHDAGGRPADHTQRAGDARPPDL
jgi:Tfp pilus assembly protein PilW